MDSIIEKWKKTGTTRTLSKVSCATKLSNRNQVVTLAELGEPARETNITATLQSGLYGTVARVKPLKGL